MKAKTYYRASSIQDAYDALTKPGKNVVLGGGLWLKRSDNLYDSIIDLQDLGLDQIKETESEFIVGSMVTLRELQLAKVSRDYFDGLLDAALNQVMGVQLRNSATIGGTIMGKFPFSDIITPLMTLDVTLEMFPHRLISIQDFINEKKRSTEILVNIHIKKAQGKARFKKVKLTDLGFAILNLAVAKIGNEYRIAIGARPMVAALATKAMDLVNGSDSEENLVKAGELACQELKFLDANGNSQDYRMHLARVYVTRLLREVK